MQVQAKRIQSRELPRSKLQRLEFFPGTTSIPQRSIVPRTPQQCDVCKQLSAATSTTNDDPFIHLFVISVEEPATTNITPATLTILASMDIDGI